MIWSMLLIPLFSATFHISFNFKLLCTFSALVPALVPNLIPKEKVMQNEVGKEEQKDKRLNCCRIEVGTKIIRFGVVESLMDHSKTHRGRLMSLEDNLYQDYSNFLFWPLVTNKPHLL